MQIRQIVPCSVIAEPVGRLVLTWRESQPLVLVLFLPALSLGAGTHRSQTAAEFEYNCGVT